MELFDTDALTGQSSMLTTGRSTMTPPLRRPTCWTFDLCSVALESGYGSAENSTEFEYPPFDFEAVREKLEKVQNIQVTLDVPTPVQYALADCRFRVKIDANFETAAKLFDSLHVNVVGPSGILYEVTQSPGNNPAEIICTYRALESGSYACHVQMGSSQCHDPSPLIMNITRRYDDKNCRPICTVDVELPATWKVEDNKVEVRKPWGLCSNTRTEQILVADRERHEILVFSPDGEFDFKFGGQGQEPGLFYRPTAVAYDPARDRILVTDKDNHRIQVFSARGEYQASFGRRGNYNTQFYFPWGIAVSNNGQFIAVADSRNHRILLFDGEFNFIRKYNAKVEGRPHSYKQEFDYPRGICFDHKCENLFVTDFNLHCLFKLDINFRNCERIMNSDLLKRPQGISLDKAGNIIVCDSRHNSIKVMSADGTVISEIKKLGNSRIDLPLDITCMRGGHLAMLDMNGRIQIF